MIGIYKITNKITKQSYIGQSTNIKKRITNHCSVYNNPNDHCYEYPLYQDMRKYGIENFEFEIIEECQSELLNDREIYWIAKFNTFDNGYNQTEGGDRAGSYYKLNKYQLQYITLELKNTKLSIQEIADKRGISYEMVQGINTGRHWHREIDYPIRKTINNENYCIKCNKKINKKSQYCIDCYKKEFYVQRPTCSELIQLMYQYSKEEIGRMYGITGNAIKKWCIAYGIPYKKKELLKYIEDNNIVIN